MFPFHLKLKGLLILRQGDILLFSLQGVQQWQWEPGWPPLPPGQSDQPPVRGHGRAHTWHQPPVDIPGERRSVWSPGDIWCRLTTSPRAGARCSMRTLSGAGWWSPPGTSPRPPDTRRTPWSATSPYTGPGPGTRWVWTELGTLRQNYEYIGGVHVSRFRVTTLVGCRGTWPRWVTQPWVSTS